MKNIPYTYLFAVLFLVIPFAAKAEEKLMELWPNQRAEYVLKSKENAAKYKARGHEYVDHLYATGGEEPSPPASDFMLESEPKAAPVPVDANQVSDIVGKYTGSIVEDPKKSAAEPAEKIQ